MKKLDKSTLKALNTIYYKTLTGILQIGPEKLDEASDGVDFKMIVYRIREKTQITLDFIREQCEVPKKKKEDKEQKNNLPKKK